MTAEVVVMNKLGVALASDSAVTISNSKKVFNGAEKLFMLIPGKPIGLLIYNNAEFMQLPWESIVKKYRSRICDKTFNTLSEYAEDFIGFLGDPLNGLYSEEQYSVTFASITYYYVSQIATAIIQNVNDYIENNAKKISANEISHIISVWIEKFHDHLDQQENLYSGQDLDTFKNGLTKYRDTVIRVRDEIFGHTQLKDLDKLKIEEFCYFLFYKKWLTEINTGIVIAGFGEEELYPCCNDYIVEHYFCGHLKYWKNQERKINPSTRGWVIPFAQQDVVRNFLDGVHPDFANKLKDLLEDVFSDQSCVELYNAIKGLSKKRKDAITNAIHKLITEKQRKVFPNVSEQFKKRHTDSVLKTVSILPKDELAKMAESLVNITSFMRRVSMDIESVGGPIDVAVISKKDGFIWIKRKHYFEPEYNPHYKTYSSGGNK